LQDATGMHPLMVSDVVLTKNSVGKEAFLQDTYAFAQSTVYEYRG
jgi:hypothetical protein